MGQSTHKARPAQGRDAVDESAPAVRPAQAFRDCPGQVLSRRISRADAGRGRAKPVPRPKGPRRERPSRTVLGEQPVADLPMRGASRFGYPEKARPVLLSPYTRLWPGITAPDCGSYGWKPVPRAASGAQSVGRWDTRVDPFVRSVRSQGVITPGPSPRTMLSGP